MSVGSSRDSALLAEMGRVRLRGQATRSTTSAAGRLDEENDGPDLREK